MKRLSLVLLPILLLLGLALGTQALQLEALPDGTSTEISDCSDVEVALDSAAPAEWPLRPSFLQASVLETGFSSCVECSAHSQCVNVCGVPWAACIPMTGCGSGKHCSCN